MTAYTTQRTTYRPYLPPLGGDTLAGVRGSLRGWRTAFRTAGSPRRQDVDFAALLLSGRD